MRTAQAYRASLGIFTLAAGIGLASACSGGTQGAGDSAGGVDAALDDATTVPGDDGSNQPSGDASTDASSTAPDATVSDAGAAPDALVVDSAADGSSADGAPADATAPIPDGGQEYAFMATYLGGIRVFSLDRQSGAPTEVDGSPFAKGPGLSGIAIDPSGTFLYGVDTEAPAVDGYRIAPATGVLSHLDGFPLVLPGAPLTISIHPSGRFAYVGYDKALAAFSIDPASGAFTPVEHSPFDVGGTAAFVAADPSGHFLYVSQAGPPGLQAFTIDDAGAVDKVDGSPFGTDSVHGGAIVFHPNGRFVYNAGGLISGFAIDPASGALAPLAGPPADGAHSDPMAVDVAIEPRGHFLYAVNNTTNALLAFAIDGTTGALTPQASSPYDGGEMPYSVAVDPDGRFLYVGNDDSNQQSVFSIDPGSGQLAPIPGSPFSPSGLEPETTIVRLPGR